MKRFLSIFLALVMLLAVMPVSTYADEAKTERDILLEKACAAFPEYASKIAADTATVAAYSARQERTVVFSETRVLSGNELVSYTEYSDVLRFLPALRPIARLHTTARLPQEHGQRLTSPSERPVPALTPTSRLPM